MKSLTSTIPNNLSYLNNTTTSKIFIDMIKTKMFITIILLMQVYIKKKTAITQAYNVLWKLKFKKRIYEHKMSFVYGIYQRLYLYTEISSTTISILRTPLLLKSKKKYLDGAAFISSQRTTCIFLNIDFLRNTSFTNIHNYIFVKKF